MSHRKHRYHRKRPAALGCFADFRPAAFYGLFLVISFLAILRPTKIHFLIMVLDELRYAGYLAVVQDSSILKHRVAVALDKELGRTALREFAIAGMDMHALHHTERREIQVIAYHLEIVVLRHGYSSIYFKFCFR
jgi:hypothetical protein